MELKVQYRSVLEEQHGTTRIKLDSIEKRNVGGLKLVLQDVLNVPASDISTYVNGIAIIDDNTPLQQLYLRENDRLSVEFYARGNISTLQQLILELNAFGKIIACFKEVKVIALSNCNTVLLSRHAYSKIDNAILKLSELFLPWNDNCTRINRRFFVQQGGVDLFVDVFRFSTKLFSSDQNSSTAYNSYQLVLMILCLRLLWNFGESKEDCQLMLSKGVEMLVLNALLLDPDSLSHYFKGDEISKTISNIHEEAIGCLAGLAETASGVQEHIAKNGLVVKKLLVIANRERCKAVMDYQMFTSQIAIGTLFFCTLNHCPLKYLIQKGVHYQIMKLLQKLMEDVNGDLLLRYYSVLFLAKVRGSQINDHDSDWTAQTIDSLIERFLGRHKPAEIRNWNVQNSCYWKSLVPFVEMAYAGGKYCICDKSQVDGSTLQSFGSSKCNCTYNVNVNAMENQTNTNTKESSVKHSPHCEVALYNQIDHMISSSKTNCKCLDRLPVLTDSDSGSLWVGSHATQRLGLFTLQCLLATKTNIYVLDKENLLPYLITLGWQLRYSEKLALKEALSYVIKNYKLTPPSLKVITCSIFARRDGFQKARSLQFY